MSGHPLSGGRNWLVCSSHSTSISWKAHRLLFCYYWVGGCVILHHSTIGLNKVWKTPYILYKWRVIQVALHTSLVSAIGMLWNTLATAVLLPPCELLKSDDSWLMPVPSAVPIKTSNFTATFVRVVQNPQHEVKSVDSVRMTWSCMAKFGKYSGRQITTDIPHMGATSKLVQWYQVSNFGCTAMHREETGKTKSKEHASSFHF